VAAASELGKKVTLVDASFQFGDVAVLLNLNPKDKSMAELVPQLEDGGDPDSVEAYTQTTPPESASCSHLHHRKWPN